jgi:pimeloyl-ACP methyl ester carboxylesterase
VPGLTDAQLAQLRRRGFLSAVLSSRRGMLDEVQKSAHQHIGRSDIPTIAIWAERDAVIPLAALGTLAQWNRNVRQETIAGAGHGVPFTHPDALIDLLGALLIEKA